LLETVEAIIKALLLLLRLIVEAGHALDISLSASGRFVIRTIWPFHWTKQVTYPRIAELLVGFASWCLLVYLIIIYWL